MELSFHCKEIENGRDRRLELHDGKAQHHLYHNLPMRRSVAPRHTEKGNIDKKIKKRT